MPHENVLRSLNEPLAQELLNAPIPARLAYTGLDGFSRVVPIWFHCDGERFIMGTGPSAEGVGAATKREGGADD
jgi:hypothetical protein